MPFTVDPHSFAGPGGHLDIQKEDELCRKIAMLIEGECGTDGPYHAARQFGYSPQRYFQLRALFNEKGSQGLVSHPRGPKTNYRRTREVVCQVIRHRFLDPEASPEVIAQKLRQTGLQISVRSVERIFEEYGLQKKTLQVPS
jgi:hypothetical protein